MTTLLRRTATWNRPMLLFAGAMAVAAVVSAVGVVVDDRELLGSAIWLKPFKFAVSMALYCVTWAWLNSLLPRGKRLASAVAGIVVALMTVEYVIIVGQVVRGRASHFNRATELDALLFRVMGYSVAAIWVGTFVLTVLLFRAPLADAATRVALRLGAPISLVGIGLGALMTGPTEAQLESMRNGTPGGMVGAHSVGVGDGGPGMPITGWSTTGGDLRIPHFVGMHALQLLPLLALVLGLLATRVPRLRSGAVRARLVAVAALGYAGFVALVTWQALRGQPLIAPDTTTLAAFGLLVTVVGVGVLGALRVPERVGAR